MDALNTALGFGYARKIQPKSLVEWNAQYEAMSLRHDWWFKAGAAVIRTVRSAIETLSTQPATAPQLAHA